MSPGRMELTRTHDAPSSSAPSCIRWSTADLLTPYAPNHRCVLLAATDEIPTNEPPPPRPISLAVCLSTYMVPLTLRSTVRRHASESTWVIGPIVSEPPAQCTTPFSRPCHATAASTIAATSSSLVTSAGSYLTSPRPSPALEAISSCAAARRSALRPTRTTSPPAAAIAVATPLPMPLPPPVTTYVRSANESCTVGPLSQN